MSQMILALSGKKSSGKNTLANFVLGLQLVKHGVVHEGFKVDERGLWISDVEGDKEFEGYLDLNRQTDIMYKFIEYIGPIVRLYSFADLLKSVAIDVLGLKYEQCYGTEADKNTLTNIHWDDMFDEIRNKYGHDVKSEQKGNIELKTVIKKQKRMGPMTAREVLQVLGTDIFRKLYDTVWVDGTITRITQDKSRLAIITDCRFPNEVKGVTKAGGKIVRLTRSITQDDKHQSETALDGYPFEYVIDNANMTYAEQNAKMFELLCEWGWFDKDGE